eukprot:TRINITY_DN3098_c2_g1_i2.p1 TRINITY_DN3098_c2_g1~~TRINITY_DN3098_c2_g1_i2.p1  ORF type:complete len:382 (-),score=102.99 TRINITY_DN3098_c2_g1_i2:102-1247(-)
MSSNKKKVSRRSNSSDRVQDNADQPPTTQRSASARPPSKQKQGKKSAAAAVAPAPAPAPPSPGNSTRRPSISNSADDRKQVSIPASPLPISEEEMHTLCVYNIHLIQGENLVAKDLNGLSDPFCVITVGSVKKRSRTVERTLNPAWDQTFMFFSDNPETILFNVWDWDQIGRNDPMGEAELETLSFFNMREVLNGVSHECTLPLKKVSQGLIKVKVSFRKFAPLRTEKLLQQASQNLEVLIASKIGQGGGAVLSGQQFEEYQQLKVKVEDNVKLLDDLQFRNNLLNNEFEAANHSLQATMLASKAAADVTPGDVKAQLTSALTKIALLEGENTALKNQKHHLQYELDSMRGGAFVGTSTEMQGLQTDGPCCVMCGRQCLIL